MRPVRIRVNAVGTSQWIPLSYLQPTFGIGLVIVPSAAALAAGFSAGVQHCFDDLDKFHDVQVSRTGTVATVYDPGHDGLGHGLSTGDSVILKASGSTYLDSPLAAIGNGEVGWTVTVTGVNSYTYAVTNAGPTVDAGVTQAYGLRVLNHTYLTGITARTDGNYAYPVRACRLNVTALTAGLVDLLVLQGLGS